MPKGEYHFESIFYFFLAKHFGFEYVPDFKVIWNKGETGLHTTVKQRLRNSSMYLLMNEDTVSKKINQVYKG